MREKKEIIVDLNKSFQSYRNDHADKEYVDHEHKVTLIEILCDIRDALVEGNKKKERPKTCNLCKGRGYIQMTKDFTPYQKPCPNGCAGVTETDLDNDKTILI